MGFCTSRHFLMSVFVLQIATLSIRQVFDFLGFMWASVLANFIYTLFIIFGIFGVIQCRSNYTIAYTVCSSVWLLWNGFVMCFYLNAFGLNREVDILSMKTGSISWWQTNGPGCKVIFLANHSAIEDPLEPLKPDFITGCIIEYQYVEIIQAALQVVLALWGCLTGIKVSHSFQGHGKSDMEVAKKESNMLPIYSIEYSSRAYGDDSSHSANEESENIISHGRRPMTPRRVKRRSIHSRGGTLSHGTSQPFHNFSTHTNHLQYQDQPPPYVRRPSYSSMRSSSRSTLSRRHRTSSDPNFDPRQSIQHQDSSTSNDSSCRIPYSSQPQFLSTTNLLEQSCSTSTIGHSNPNFSSNTSLDRPPSARSSYSNYHGIRTFSYTNNQATPQVPIVNTRRSVRPSPSSFLNSGPPAYEIQGCVNSETVI